MKKRPLTEAGHAEGWNVKKTIKWTLSGCVVVYLLLTLESMFETGAILRAARVTLYVIILGLTAWLVLTWILPKLIRTTPKSD